MLPQLFYCLRSAGRKLNGLPMIRQVRQKLWLRSISGVFLLRTDEGCMRSLKGTSTGSVNESVATLLVEACKSSVELFERGLLNIYGRQYSCHDPALWFSDGVHKVSLRGAVPSDLWSNRADIKVVWKQSCCHFLIPPSIKAAVCGDRRLASEVCDVMEHWTAANQDPQGVNWYSPLAVSLRLASWAYIWHILQGCWDENQKEIILTALIEKANFVLVNCEHQPLRSNHFAGCLSGLACFALWFPEVDKDGCLLRFAVNHLHRIARRQFNREGVHFEFSLHYHRLVCELLLMPYFIALLTGRGALFRDSYRRRLSKGVQLLENAVNREGLLPQIGDNDSEVLCCVALENGSPRDIRPFLTLCHHFLDGHFRSYTPAENMLMLSGYGIPLVEKGGGCKSSGSTHYTSPGWIFVRTNRLDVALVCGPIGTRGLGGHDHNHCNQVLISLDGLEFVVDPGTGCYTRDLALRNTLRSVRSHSTVDAGVEPGQWRDGLDDLWRIRWPWLARVSRPSADCYEMLCRYSRILHYRRVEFDKRAVSVADTIQGAAAFTQCWILHPEVQITMTSPTRVVCSRGNSMLVLESKQKWRMEERLYAEAFGRIGYTKALILNGEHEVGCAISTDSVSPT